MCLKYSLAFKECFIHMNSKCMLRNMLSSLYETFSNKIIVAHWCYLWNYYKLLDKIICSCKNKHYYKWNKISCIYTLYWNINKLVKFSIRLFALAKLKKNDFLGTWNTINATMHFKMQCNFFNATIDIILFTILHQGKF